MLLFEEKSQFQVFWVLTCIIEPLLEQWLQLAHVFKAQVEGFKAGDGGLAEVVTVQFAHRHADISLIETHKQCQKHTEMTLCPSSYFLHLIFYLGESQLDAPLFEGAGKLFQLLQVAGFFPQMTPVTPVTPVTPSRSQSGGQRGSHGTA